MRKENEKLNIVIKLNFRLQILVEGILFGFPIKKNQGMTAKSKLVYECN